MVSITHGARPPGSEHYKAAGEIPNHGPLAVQTPGMVGLATLYVVHGSLSWARLAEPAIEAAQNGFAATHALHHFCKENRHRLGLDSPAQ